MERFFTVIVLGGVALLPRPFGRAQESSHMSLESSNSLGALPALPAAPGGESTVIGGEIRSVDPVQDQLVLKVFGQKELKILYDARTQVYRDGKKIPLRDLGSEQHASVQTVLDGSKVYAISVHILSQAPAGECQGRVLRFDPATGELLIRSSLSPEPLKLFVPRETPVVRVGQPAFVRTQAEGSDLVPGSLISATFQAAGARRNVVNKIAVLAVPGFNFVFAGDISFLDMGAGEMVLADAQNGQSYQIHFDPALFPESQNLHMGQHVNVVATFDGSRYAASRITIQ